VNREANSLFSEQSGKNQQKFVLFFLNFLVFSVFSQPIFIPTDWLATPRRPFFVVLFHAKGTVVSEQPLSIYLRALCRYLPEKASEGVKSYPFPNA